MTIPDDVFDQDEEPFNDQWDPEAWVYFIWLVAGNRVYLKVGRSVNPLNRYEQLAAGMPEEPYELHLLACLNEEQASIFERMIHRHLDYFKTRGEWFSHANVKHLKGVLENKLEELLMLFYTFGFKPHFEKIMLNGHHPILHQNGFLSHVIAAKELLIE